MSAIEDILVFLENQMGDMKQTISQNSSNLLYKILMDLLYRKDISEEEIKKKLELCRITLKQFQNWLTPFCI